ncbi:MAG TPA: four helix bundle protein [Chloroflexota bacterium]|nr:four helix bundle protein [Chloroflexota bacterium]
MVIHSFRDLRVWQEAMDLVEAIYQVTRDFPRHEIYGLTSQIQRAAVSVPANIAEGHARHHGREYLQHLAVAQASLAEVDTHLEIAVRLSYITVETADPIQQHIASLGRQLRSLRQALSRRITT